MKFDYEKVAKAAKAIEDLCLKCTKHSDSCYVAIAKRAIATLKKAVGKEVQENE